MQEVTTLTYSIPGAIKASGFSRTRLYNLLGDGEIVAIKVGRRTLIKADSLRDYINKMPPAIIRKAA